ncbi:MAG: hypothetical protein KDJ99_07340 [Candidatus Competibacteraceae bacterium]|nr:hypothetical protein [Candidatus Competibacteraceae bacterium]
MTTPARPDIVLRVALSGKRDLSKAEPAQLKTRLHDVFQVLNQSLASLRDETQQTNTVAHYYADSQPRLRLISGLADGADQLAMQTFLAQTSESIDLELAAVLPFDVQTYRDHSPIENKALFDELLTQCAYVLELDGRYLPDPKSEDTAARNFAKHCRARAYRAQGTLLLRQCDLLIAIDDYQDEGRVGGTRETIRHALARGIPVLYLALDQPDIVLLHSPAELENVLLPVDSAGTNDWREDLQQQVARLLADPQATLHNRRLHRDNSTLNADERAFLEEYFEQTNSAAVHPATPEQEPRSGFRQFAFRIGIPWRWVKTRYGRFNRFIDQQLDCCRPNLWQHFNRRFQNNESESAPAKGDPTLEPFSTYRKRAASLSRQYSSQYRGAFLLNYVLALVAVIMAVGSLIVMLWPDHDLTKWHYLTLFVLGGVKFTAVLLIYRNTHAANHGHWNDKAIDYRYLAERLRAMLYLPQLGCLQPPAPSTPQYASRVLQQSVVDWLFQAIVRQVPPQHVLTAKHAQPPLLHAQPTEVLQDLRQRWLQSQSTYHRANAKTNARMSRALESWGARLSKLVIWIVLGDLLILLIKAFHWYASCYEGLLFLAGVLALFLAAVIPAAVASLNGIQAQSECRRLADRSEVMSMLLASLDHDAERLLKAIEQHHTQAERDPGSWLSESLEVAESCARIMVEEVAEWSVLYAKDVPEP